MNSIPVNNTSGKIISSDVCFVLFPQRIFSLLANPEFIEGERGSDLLTEILVRLPSNRT